MVGSVDPSAKTTQFSLSDFPDDVQICILSFLSPSDLSSFCCTSKLFASLCHAESKLWYALCERRWGSKTEIKKWGNGQVGFKLLYRTLVKYENLIGFWCRGGDSGDSPSFASNAVNSSTLVFFEWGPSFVAGSMVSPSKNSGYNVIKATFIWLCISPEGEALSHLDLNCRFVSENPDCSDKDLIPVDVSFVGTCHVFLEESRDLGTRGGGISSYSGSVRAGNELQMSGSFPNSSGEEFSGVELKNVNGVEIGSSPDRLMSEMYQHFANRMSPRAGGERAWRRQRRRESEVRARRRWVTEHLAKIADTYPSPSRPLQGLWKGVCEDMTLTFYLITYDNVGGITCRRVTLLSKALSVGPPVFWTSDTTFLEPPFSPDEELLYSSRLHLKPNADAATHSSDILHSRDDEIVARVMYVNSCYDLVIPNLAETAANPRHAEGRIWQYTDGSFGFGFLRNNFIVDLKHIARDGRLLDTN